VITVADLGARTLVTEPQRWLTADGRALVRAEGHERWVIVHVVDLTIRAALDATSDDRRR
jgi:hypothetical protein